MPESTIMIHEDEERMRRFWISSCERRATA